ncbi:hypothetical protein OROGR_021525 [Orobanche gracilis]
MASVRGLTMPFSVKLLRRADAAFVNGKNGVVLAGPFRYQRLGRWY